MLGWSNQASAAVQTVFQTLGGLRRVGRGDGAVGGFSAVLVHLWGSPFNGG